MGTAKKKSASKRKDVSQIFATGRLTKGNFGAQPEAKKKKKTDREIANTRQGPGPKKEESGGTASIVGTIARAIKNKRDKKARQSAIKARVAAKKRLDAKKKKGAK